jgi:hypothetical protein
MIVLWIQRDDRKSKALHPQTLQASYRTLEVLVETLDVITRTLFFEPVVEGFGQGLGLACYDLSAFVGSLMSFGDSPLHSRH